MSGVFVDEFLTLEQQNILFRGLTPTAAYTVPFEADITPTPATVFADLNADTSKQQAWTYTDWLFTLPAPGQSKASLLRTFAFSPGDFGKTYYGAALYALFGSAEVLMYAERWPVAFIVPASGGELNFQYNLFLAGACP